MKKLPALLAILFAFCLYATPVQTVEASEKTENFVIYSTPIGYAEWKEAGNYFWGGFEGFCNYFSSLDEVEKLIFIFNGRYSNDGALPSKPLKEWRDNNNDLEVPYMYRVLR